MEEVTANHDASSALSGLAMYDCNVLWIGRQPQLYILAKRSDERKCWWVMIVKRKMANPAVKLSWIINFFGAEVVNFVVIWMFFVQKLLDLIQYLNPEEAELFDIDLRRLDLVLHAKQSMYGVGKYYNGLDLLPPGDPLQQILKLNSLDYNHDIKFAMKSVKNFKERDLAKFTQAVLNG